MEKLKIKQLEEERVERGTYNNGKSVANNGWWVAEMGVRNREVRSFQELER